MVAVESRPSLTNKLSLLCYHYFGYPGGPKRLNIAADSALENKSGEEIVKSVFHARMGVFRFESP